jgi:hypothetical protein
MATLGELLRAVLPGAAPLAPGADAGESGAERSVGWVRVMRSRVPAFEALASGDLVMVPEGALAAVVHEPDDAARVAEELRRADVAAVVILGEPPAGEAGAPAVAAPAVVALGSEAMARSLPVYRLESGDAAVLERAVIGYLVNARAELERQVARLESELQSVALAGGGLQAMAAAIAGFLRRAVVVEDADRAIVAAHAPPRAPGAALAAARYEEQRGPAALWADLPAGGRFVLLGQEPPSELEATAAPRIAVLLALELARDAAVQRTRDRGAEVLPAAGPPWVVLMARQTLPGEQSSIDERERRRERVRRLGPARRVLLRGDAASIELRAVAAAVPEDPHGLELATRMARLLERPVAVSRPFSDRMARPAADAEARALLEAGDELAAVGYPPPVLRADRLAEYRLLGSLHNLPDGERQARALLGPLLVGSARAQAERLATLAAFLDGAGQAGAAGALGVHRNTVAYRLRRIEALTGWSLDDPELRFAISLALWFVRKPQISG